MGARRVIVGVHGSLGSLQALRWAAEEARERQATLVPVIAWLPPGGDFAERSHPSGYLRRAWRDAAADRLAEAFETGLGGLPDDIPVQTRIERGDTGPVLVDAGRPAGRPARHRHRAAPPGRPGCCAGRSGATASPTPAARCSRCRRRP